MARDRTARFRRVVGASFIVYSPFPAFHAKYMVQSFGMPTELFLALQSKTGKAVGNRLSMIGPILCTTGTVLMDTNKNFESPATTTIETGFLNANVYS
jgi:hypothetical protein